MSKPNNLFDDPPFKDDDKKNVSNTKEDQL